MLRARGELTASNLTGTSRRLMTIGCMQMTGIAAECLRILNFRLTNPLGIPANGAAPRGGRNAFDVIGPGEVGARTRREPVLGLDGAIHGANGPAPTPTVFGHVQPRKKKKDQKQKRNGRLAFVEPSPRSAAFRPVREAERSSAHTAQRATRFCCSLSLPWLDARNLSGGWVGWRVSRHGSGACARRVGQDATRLPCAQDSAHVQAPMDGFTASPLAPPTRPAPRKQAFRDQATRGCVVGWKLRPPAVPEPGEMIGRPLERIARTHPATQQVHRQVQRPQHHVLVDMRTLMVVEPDQRLHAPPRLMRVGPAEMPDRPCAGSHCPR